MLTTLRVGEVGAIVLVDCQTEAALEGAYMVLEKVGILIKVDCLESEFPKSFSSVRVGAGVRGNTASSEFRSCTIL